MANGFAETSDKAASAHARKVGKIADAPGPCRVIVHGDQTGVQVGMGEARQKPGISRPLSDGPTNSMDDDNLAQPLADECTPATRILVFQKGKIGECPDWGVLRQIEGDFLGQRAGQRVESPAELEPDQRQWRSIRHRPSGPWPIVNMRRRCASIPGDDEKVRRVGGIARPGLEWEGAHEGEQPIMLSRLCGTFDHSISLIFIRF